MLDPTDDHLTQRPDGNVIAYLTALHALLENTEEDVAVTLDLTVTMATEVAGKTPHFHEKHPGENTIGPVHMKVTPDELSEPVQGALDAAEVYFNLTYILVQEITENLVQKSAFITEISVNQGFVDTRGSGNFGGGDLVEFLVFQQITECIGELHSAGRVRAGFGMGYFLIVCHGLSKL